MIPTSDWMAVTAVAANFDYPTNGAGGVSTTAGNSFLVIPAVTQSALVAAPARRPSVIVHGYLIVTGPAANATITIENHDGSRSHVSSLCINTNNLSLSTYTRMGSGIYLPGGLRVQLSAAATVNVYFSVVD